MVVDWLHVSILGGMIIDTSGREARQQRWSRVLKRWNGMLLACTERATEVRARRDERTAAAWCGCGVECVCGGG